MRLIGMLDSPYVRRVAICLKLMDLPFVHESVSVFRQFDHFFALNPVVKAPSLITDEGVVLMDSTVILDYLDRLADPDLRLIPSDLDDYLKAQRVIGLALAACEKSVQLVYELNLRPAEKQHAPWVARVQGQLAAALSLLEAELEDDGAWLFGARPMLADVTAAVAFRFNHHVRPEAIADECAPRLLALSARAEALPSFRDTLLEGASVRSD